MSLFQRFTNNGRHTNRFSFPQPSAPPLAASELPPTLWYQGRMITHRGPGGTPGSHLYRDGQYTLELYECQVTHTGPYFSQAQAAFNPSLQRIRVPNGTNDLQNLHVGELLIVGPIEFTPEGPQTRSAWRIRTQPSPRRAGTIVDVRGSYGFIRDAQTGDTVFVHRNSLRPGTFLVAGLHVRYVLWHNERGPTAADVSAR